MLPTPGENLLHYRLAEPIGAGGMGEVWRATDTTLGRDVAIKVLPAAVADDPERLVRLEREAKVLAALNHPHVAAIYGMHETHGVRFLVMELVPGEDLAQRLERGAIPLDEALPLARQIAEALEYAHEHGIVHRDLKPANVKLTPEGGVKVLDFGLAKAIVDEPPSSGPTSTPTVLPTRTSAGTIAGVILGTAAYMSPEQARGRAVDRRTDIWAFGVVLYEMLVGRRLFDGETVSDTIAAVLRSEPDFARLPAGTPPAVRRLLERCLDRDPHTRLRDAGEARIALSQTGGELPQPAKLRVGAALGAALLAGVAAGRFLLAPRATPAAPGFAFDVSAGRRTQLGSFALSPDGRYLVFAVSASEGTTELWLRPLDSFDMRPLPGTRGARQPFWSPDSREIAFFSGADLQRMALGEAAPHRIASAPLADGGTWNAEGVILFGGGNAQPIFRVSAGGGAVPMALTQLEPGVEDAHVWPAFLPDGRRFVFLADASSDDGHRVRLGSLDGRPTTILLKRIRSSVRVDPRGALLLVQANQLVAHPFDFAAGRLAGDARLVVDGVYPVGVHHDSPFALSTNGRLAYQSESAAAVLTRVDAQGAVVASLGPSERVSSPAVSRDGRWLAYELQEGPDERRIWIQDVARGARRPLSERGKIADSAVWSDDGETVYFDSSADGSWKVYRARVNGGGPPENLGSPPGLDLTVLDCSRDGQLLVAINVGAGNWDLLLRATNVADAPWVPWLNTPSSESYGVFSPDSRWIAYVSEGSGRGEVFIAPTRGGGEAQRWQISADGGVEPCWSPDGARVYYRSPASELMAVDLTFSAAGRVEAGAPRRLFEMLTPNLAMARNMYDVAPDGSLVLIRPSSTDPPVIHVLTGYSIPH